MNEVSGVKRKEEEEKGDPISVPVSAPTEGSRRSTGVPCEEGSSCSARKAQGRREADRKVQSKARQGKAR